MYKKYILCLLSGIFTSLFLPHISYAKTSPDLRNDSFDVQHYTIALDISDFTGKTISGHCVVMAKSKINQLQRLTLELYKLQVDSVLVDQKKASFFYNDSILVPQFSTAYQAGDGFNVDVYYHGHPASTDFGGFYFSTANGGIAFNMGVGLYTIPHNMGRVWFPCIDDFTDKATYSFYIQTQPQHKAFCNGLLKDSTLVAGDTKRLWHWELAQPIVPYLASVSVSRYATIYSEYDGMNGKIPIQIGVYPGDSTKAITYFANLKRCLKAFEEMFGPYPFDRVGYVGVPFSSGAMEHASNIAFPEGLIGSNDQTVWPHELSHHWWGDLVTCSTAYDMWLNEGWASFCESLYYEKLYGKEDYRVYALYTHAFVLQYVNWMDGGYRALSPMDQNFTYGQTTYSKGSGVIHTLRSQMGDSLFFKGIRHYLDKFAWKSADAEDCKTALEEATGLDLTSFFNTYVYSPGFTHFEVVKYTIEQQGSQYLVKDMAIEQQLKECPVFHKDARVVISFWDDKWNRIDKTITMGNWGSLTTTLPFKPVFIQANIEGQINDAATNYYYTIRKTGNMNLNDISAFQLSVDQLQDSALFFISYHKIGAQRSPQLAKNIRISGERYWTLDGIWPQSFQAHATIIYDGRTTNNPLASGYLDNELIKDSEDSLLLLYREYPWDEWIQYPNYVKNMGSKTDKYGTIRINNLKKGQYALGMIDETASIPEEQPKSHGMNVYPNPANTSITISLNEDEHIDGLMLYDMQGKLIFQDAKARQAGRYSLSTAELGSGMYMLRIQSGLHSYAQPVMIRH